MSPTSKSEYLKQIKQRYKKSSKKEKTKILDEFCKICCYNRKYAIRILSSNKLTSKKLTPKKRGRKKKYSDPLIIEVIHDVWSKANLPCAKRLKAILPLWLPHYEYHIPEHVYDLLLSISPSTIDRLMAQSRSRFNKLGLATTKPGSILKKHIPIKTNQWDEKNPGFIEADSVAHCGTSTAGSFALTVNCVDICTQWTQQRAVWGKGEKGVFEAIRSMETTFPFELKGFDCDNGSEFLNWHLVRYFQERKNPVQFTRARAYHKNDNAHIENKNWTHVRQYLGYQRFDNPVIVSMLNDLYTGEWTLFHNFFMPSVKLVKKYRSGSKIKKIYDTPKTPFQRLCESPAIEDDVKIRLKELFNNCNPFQLEKKIRSKIKKILKVAHSS